MITKSGKETKQRRIVTGLILLVILALTILVLVRIVAKTEERAYEVIKESAVNSDTILATLIEDTFSTLDVAGSVYLDRCEVSEDEAMSAAETITDMHIGVLGMEVRIYLPDGSAFIDGEYYDVSEYVDYDAILELMDDNRAISNCKFDYIHVNKQVMEIYKALGSDNDTPAIITAVLDIKALPEYMTSASFDGRSNTLVVDTRDGTVFLDTFHNTKEIEKIDVFYDRKDKKGNSVVPFFENILAGKEGYTTLKSQSLGKVIYLYSVPSKIKGWATVIFVDDAEAFSESRSIGNILIQLVAIELLILLIYVVWIYGQAKKQAISDSKKLISKMTDDDSLFIVDYVKDTRKTIYNNSYRADEYYDDEKMSESYSKYVNGYVAEADREMMLEAMSPEYIKKRLKSENEYSVQYRDISMGIQRFNIMKITKLSGTEVLQSFVEKDEEIMNNLVFDKLRDDYFAFFVIDLDSGLYRVMKASPWFNSGELRTIKEYTPMMKFFAESFEGETKEFFEKISNIETIKNLFAEMDKASYRYSSHIVEGTKWVNINGIVLTRNSDGSPSLFAMGFSILDEYSSKTQELQTHLKEDMQMIGGLASEYHTLYYYNIDENIFKIYSLDGQRYPELTRYFEEDFVPLEMLRSFGTSELVHPDDRHFFEDLSVESVREELAHSKKYSVRFRRDYEGNYVWLEMDIVKYEDIDKQANAIAIGFAVRDKEIRKEQKQQKDLEDARNAADAANVSKTNFLFNMSHDIRTPMNAIAGFTTLAKKYAYDKDRVVGYLNKIEMSSKQLLMLINQVLEMARIETGKIELDNKPVNVREQFNSTTTILSEQAATNGLEFFYSFENIQHESVLADEARMGSITFNILGNAMKYTPEGGRVDFILKEIAPRKDDYATFVLTVIDTGIGMSEEYLKKIFEPFSREKNSTVSKIQGTGLGMSIVKNLVDLMGGDIEVESEVGKGTRFDVTMDFKIADTYKIPSHPVVDISKKSFEGRMALLVEDNELNREIAKAILELRGFTVEEANDGDVAVEMIRKIAERDQYSYYDIILMDIQMPTMNGYDATKAIREIYRPGNIHVPIIAMTANAFSEDRQNAIDAGMDDHVAKPIELKKFIETLAKYLG